MTNRKRPQLDIPTSDDPEEMDWVHGVVVYPEPKLIKPKQEGWSESYMYGIKSNNVEYVLFASPTFHEKIQETGATKDTVIRLARLGEGTSTRWFAKYVNGPRQQAEQAEEPIPGFDEPVDQYDAPAYRPEPVEQPQSQPVQQNTYKRMNVNVVAFLKAMLEDIQAVRMLADETVRANYPNAWDELEQLDRENLISTVATGNRITLDTQLRAMVGGWNERSDYGAFNGWQAKNGASQKQEESNNLEEDEEEYTEPEDERWQAIKRVNLNNPKTRGKNLAAAIAALDDNIDAPNHVTSILKRFGYTSAGIDREVHWQMAQMVWLYAGLRKEGAEQNQALKITAEMFGHPLDMIEWFPIEPDDEPDSVSEAEIENHDSEGGFDAGASNVTKEDIKRIAAELRGVVASNPLEEDLDDEMAF